MFRPFLPLIAAVCLTTAAAFSFAGQGPAILANPVISATVTVECQRPEGRRMLSSTGTGTVVAPDVVLTCAHDTFATDRITVRSGGQVVEGRLAAVDRRADAAVIRLASPLEGVEPIRVSSDVSDALETAGVGAGVFQWRTTRVLRQLPLTNGQHSFVTSGTARPGDSGSGMFNDRGQLVGVVWGSVNGETYVTAGEPLFALLKRALGPQYQTVVEFAP